MSYACEPRYALQALMHELGESTCGDMTGPLKSICPDYKRVEKNCEAAALTRFGVVIDDPDAIKLLDLRMLATERRDLMRWNGEEWDWTKGAQPFDFEIVPGTTPEVAAEVFLAKYQELTAR